jgi:dihydrofolate reductase
MNAMPKFVRTRGTPDLSVWARSEALVGDLADSVSRLASERDLVVIGSIGLVRDLASAGLVDEYRLLTVPTFVGAGQTLFATVTDLDLVSVETDGPLLLSTYRPAG